MNVDQKKNEYTPPAVSSRARTHNHRPLTTGGKWAYYYSEQPASGTPPGQRRGKTKESDRQGRAAEEGKGGRGEPTGTFFWRASTGSNGGCQCTPSRWADSCRARSAGREGSPSSNGSKSTLSTIDAGARVDSGPRGPIELRSIHAHDCSPERVVQLMSDDFSRQLEPRPFKPLPPTPVHKCSPYCVLIPYEEEVSVSTTAKAQGVAPQQFAPPQVLPQGVYQVTYAEIPGAVSNCISLPPPVRSNIVVAVEGVEIPRRREVPRSVWPYTSWKMPNFSLRPWWLPVGGGEDGDRPSFSARVAACVQFLFTGCFMFYTWLRPTALRDQPRIGDRRACAHCRVRRCWRPFLRMSGLWTLVSGVCGLWVRYGTLHPMVYYNSLAGASNLLPVGNAYLLAPIYVLGIAYYARHYLFRYYECIIHSAETEAAYNGTQVDYVLFFYNSLLLASRTPDELRAQKMRFTSWLRTRSPDMPVEESTWHISQALQSALRLSDVQMRWAADLSEALPDLWAAHRLSRSGDLGGGAVLPTI